MGAQQGKLTESYVVGTEERFEQDPTESKIGQFNSIPECIRYHAETKPDRDALVFCSTTEPRFAVTFKELYERSCQMAAAFEEMGLKAGETVVFVSRTCAEWYYCAIGAMMLRASVLTTTLTYNDGSDVIKLMKKLQNCSLFILDPGNVDSNWKIVDPLIADLDKSGKVSSNVIPFLRYMIFLSRPEDSTKRFLTVSELLDTHKPREFVTIDSDNLAMMFQTSGSTGEPKLVAYTHRNLMKPQYLYDYARIEGMLNSFNDRPFFWISSLMVDTIKGATRTTISGRCPEPSDYIGFLIHVIQTERCNVALMIPPMIYEIVERKKELAADWPMKLLFTGGQPITESLTTCIGTVCQWLGVVYGASEFMFGSGVLLKDMNSFVDYAAGRPATNCEIKIVNDEGKVVPVGERGEIYVKAGWSFKEYFNDLEKTKTAITEDGWYKTDDLGRINSDGILFVEGRKSDIIITGVKNVSPSVLERVLKAHPDVDDAVIVPVPDEKLYQVICACVKVKEGSDVTESTLRDYIEQTHADKTDLFTALPKFYMILDKIPKTRTGKVSRPTLKLMAEQKFVHSS